MWKVLVQSAAGVSQGSLLVPKLFLTYIFFVIYFSKFNFIHHQESLNVIRSQRYQSVLNIKNIKK
jgi:hypothetical protein